jgi:putative transposase
VDPIDLVADHKINRFFRARKKLTQGRVVSHITQRAAGKDPCFVEEEDFLCMLGFLKESVQKHDYEIFSFCIMENHAHLLLRPSRENLQDAMRDLFSRYAMWFNRKYERRGHLFGGPYRQAVCLDDAYLLAASVYIHLNPVKAEIVPDPGDYRWSSARLFMEERTTISFVDHSFILKMLTNDSGDAKKRYRRLLEKGGVLPIDYAQAQETGIEHFKKKLMSAVPGIFSRLVTTRTVATVAGKEILNMEALEKRIDEALTQHGKRKPASRQALKFLIEQLISRGFKRSEIAERLHISPKTVYNLLKTL